jgi:hypothetical protein
VLTAHTERHDRTFSRMRVSPTHIGIPVERGAVKRLWCELTWRSGLEARMCGRGEADVNPRADAWGGNLVGQGLQLEGLIDGRGTVDAGFDPSGSRSRAGSPVGRVLGAYLRHAPVGGAHEAVGHGQREVQSHSSTALTGHADTSRSSRWPCPTLTPRWWRGIGARRHAARRTPG